MVARVSIGLSHLYTSLNAGRASFTLGDAWHGDIMCTPSCDMSQAMNNEVAVYPLWTLSLVCFQISYAPRCHDAELRLRLRDPADLLA